MGMVQNTIWMTRGICSFTNSKVENELFSFLIVIHISDCSNTNPIIQLWVTKFLSLWIQVKNMNCKTNWRIWKMTFRLPFFIVFVSVSHILCERVQIRWVYFFSIHFQVLFSVHFQVLFSAFEIDSECKSGILIPPLIDFPFFIKISDFAL